MMVRRDVAGRKLSRASGWLDSAAEYFDRTVEEFTADVRGRDLATFYLFLAIQECLDLAAHWVADAGWTVPDEAGGTFDVLADRDVISRDLAAALRAAVGLRNRIAHGYALLDHRRLHEEAATGVPALRRFLKGIADAAGL